MAEAHLKPGGKILILLFVLVIGGLGVYKLRDQIFPEKRGPGDRLVASLISRSLAASSAASSDTVLALRTDSPIFVAREVLEASSVLSEAKEEAATPSQDLSDLSPDEWKKVLEKLDPEDFKYKM